MFHTNPKDLDELLIDVRTSKIQLPDFQRGWVWDDDSIKELLISISSGFPIGAIMMLEAGGEIQWKCHPIQGVEEHIHTKANQYLLDGQQRLTSLFQSLMKEGPVKTRNQYGREVEQWYFLNLKAYFEPITDGEEVIVSVSANKRETNYWEYKEHMMPSREVLKPANWMLKYTEYWKNCKTKHPTGDITEFLLKIESGVLHKFGKYKLPVICLDNQNSKEAVCKVFEKVNSTGVSLTVFELVTAIFAADDFSLRDDWASRRDRLHTDYGVLQGIEGEHFLQVIALLKTHKRYKEAKLNQHNTLHGKVPGVSCKKGDILSLSVEDYQDWADELEEGFKQAAKFIHFQFIFRERDLPYKAQLISLAAIYVELSKMLEPVNAQEQLEQWFWSGIFGEKYSSAVETQYVLDLVEVTDWIRGGHTPEMMGTAYLTPERLLSLRTRNSAAYKGLYALQMKNGATDWRTGKELSVANWHKNHIDIHHIFPKAWCNNYDPPIRPNIFNSIINKTPIDATTNRKIGGKSPSLYLRTLEKEVGATKLKDILESHWISPELLYVDDFAEFFVERGVAMIDLIYQAMGKPPPDSSSEDIFRKAIDYVIETPTEEMEVEYNEVGEQTFVL